MTTSIEPLPELDADVWLNAPTAALVLAFSPQYLGRLAAHERVPARRRGPHWYFRRRDIEVRAAARAFERRLDADHRLAG